MSSDFRTIELVPLSKKELIIIDENRAENARASIKWLADVGYGLMFHWTSQSVLPDGTINEFEKSVDMFNVDSFVDMVDETGAGYAIFTLGHAEPYCPAPIRSWERIHPGHTTQRDLIEEITSALERKGILLICYIHAPSVFQFPKKGVIPPKIKQTFIDNYPEILTEIGKRYKSE